MTKHRPTYRIEHYCTIRQKWVTMMTWWGMPKCRAEGAFMVLCALYGGQEKYRLTEDGTNRVIETHDTGTLKLN